MRAVVKHIALSLREDTTWKSDKHWVGNDKLGVNVWIASGFWFLHLRWYAERRSYGGWGDSEDVKLSLLEKAYLWWAIKKLRKLSKQRAEDAILEAVIQRRLNIKE